MSRFPPNDAPRVAKLPECRMHLVDRLRRQIEATSEAQLAALLRELSSYPGKGAEAHTSPSLRASGAFVPIEPMTEAGRPSFLATTTMFGAPLDITLSELALEAFFAANAEAETNLRRLPTMD